MRVCLVSKEAAEVSPGDIGTYVIEAGKALSSAGHEVWLLTADPGKDRRSSIRSIPCFHRVLFAGEGLGKEGRPEFLQGLPHYSYSDLVHRTLMSAGTRFDYIEFPDFHAEGIVPVREQRLLGSYGDAVLGVVLHTPTYECLLFDGALHRLDYTLRHICSMEDYTLRNASLRTSPSRDLLGIVARRLGIPEPAGSLVPYPFHPSRETPRPPRRVRRLEELTFLYFGRLEPRKGLEALVKAFSLLPELKLRITGEDTPTDPLGGSYRDFLASKAPPNVEFLEKTGDTELLEAACEADVCLFPSVRENFPYSFVKAMALGRVVIAGKRGGMGEVVVHGESGFLVEGGDPEEIARCIREDLGRNLDRLPEIGRNGARRIGEVTDPERFARRVEESVAEAASRTRRREGAGRRGKKVSVVIPFYGGKDSVARAVESALAQTHPEVEVLVVDDGSPLPEADAILEDLLSRDPRVRVVRKENGGLASARNKGIEEARGDYLIFLDDDDSIHPRYAEWGVAAMERNPSLGFLTSYTKFEDTSGRNPTYCFNPMPFNWSTALILNQFGTAGAFFRKETFLERGIRYDEALSAYEDWALWMDLAREGVEGDVIPRICYDYKIRRGSMMESKGWPNHPALVGLLIHRHFPVAGPREREVLTVLNQTWGRIALAVRLSGASLTGGGAFSANLAVDPSPLVHVPLRHKVVDALAAKAARIPFLSKVLRKVLVLIFRGLGGKA